MVMMPLLRSFPVKLCFVSRHVSVCVCVCRTEGQPLPEHQGWSPCCLARLLPGALKSGGHLWLIFSPWERPSCPPPHSPHCWGGSLVPTKGMSLLFLPCSSQGSLQLLHLCLACPVLSHCLPRVACRRLWPSGWAGASSAPPGEAGWLRPGSPCKGESKGSWNESSVLISQAAPHSRNKSGTVSTLLISHRPRGIFFSREGVIIILRPKGPKISACWKQATIGGFIPGSLGWGELGLMHTPCPRNSSAWQKKETETEVQRGAGCKSLTAAPVPVPCFSHSGNKRGRLPSSPQGHPHCSRAWLFLCFPWTMLRLQSGSCGQC